jgi:hypothetical protein
MKSWPEISSGEPTFSYLSWYEWLSTADKENLKVVDDVGLSDLLIQYHNGDKNYLKDLAKALFSTKLSGNDFPWSLKDHIGYLIRITSDRIDGKWAYRSQAETVRQCLKEAFGEYAQDIRITDAFFFELEFFMRRMRELKEYRGPKEWDKYDEVVDGAISGGNAIKWAVIDYGSKADDRMEEDLRKQWKNEAEVASLTKARYDKFLSLLRERIQYEAE